MILINQEITEEIKEEIKKYLETNGNENTMTERMRRAGQRDKCYREAQREKPSMVYRQS